MIARVVVPLLALLVALAVPTSQLRLIAIEHSCCCPDPDQCRCPHDLPTKQPTLRSCHSTDVVIQSATPPVFTAPVIASVDVPAIAVAVVPAGLDVPHPPPTPRRPDAPS